MQVGICNIFLALVPMGRILVSIDTTFSTNQYQAKYPHSGYCVQGVNVSLDFFPNWQNSVQIAALQVIGHALLSINFNTLQPYLQT